MHKTVNLLKRVGSVFVTTLVAFSFIPTALANNSTIQDVTLSPDPFHIQIPGHDDQAKIFFSYKWDAGGYASGDVIEKITDANDNTVYYWGATEGADTRMDAVPATTETVSLEWNGKGNIGTYNGQYVPNGTYKFYVNSHVTVPPDATATKTFTVEKTIAPAVSWVTTPAGVYYTGSGNYSVNYNLLLKSASQSKVTLKITGPSNNNPQDVIISEMKMADGNYILNWDGKINNNTAASGQYTYSLQPEGSVDGFGTLGNQLTGQFTVNNGNAPQPVISDVAAAENPYNPTAGNQTFNYKLAGSSGNTTVMAGVFSSNDNNNPKKSWTFSSQSSGSNTVVWDGKNSDSVVVDNGSYIFKVWGSDGSFSLVPMQTSFVVNAQSSGGNNGKCAGFKDVAGSDSDCEAIEYMKSIGAMTGNPDGTFAPEELLQRDQVAKIILETFNKYSNGTDYCGGTAAFSDVTSGSWAYQYICRGVDLGMITGYKSGADAGFYRPARSVNRVEFLALLLRNLSDSMPSNSQPSYNDVPVDQWFSGYARYAKDHDLFTGNNLYPTSYTTRREVAEIIFMLHELGKI